MLHSWDCAVPSVSLQLFGVIALSPSVRRMATSVKQMEPAWPLLRSLTAKSSTPVGVSHRKALSPLDNPFTAGVQRAWSTSTVATRTTATASTSNFPQVQIGPHRRTHFRLFLLLSAISFAVGFSFCNNLWLIVKLWNLFFCRIRLYVQSGFNGNVQTLQNIRFCRLQIILWISKGHLVCNLEFKSGKFVEPGCLKSNSLFLHPPLFSDD